MNIDPELVRTCGVLALHSHTEAEPCNNSCSIYDRRCATICRGPDSWPWTCSTCRNRSRNGNTMADPQDQGDQGGFGLVMPFVTVASKGGPHEDVAYVCGWEMGQLDAKLSVIASIGVHITLSVQLHTANLPQADLIAMKYGYAGALVGQSECGGYSQVNYSPMTPVG